MLSSEASAEAGRWITARAEYQRGMMDAVCEPDVNTVVIMSSAQIGKSEMLLNIVAYYIDYDPCPILNLQPTLEMARAWSTDRIAPMFRDTPTLKGRVVNGGKAKSSDTILHKQFAGGHITMAGANSPSSLASRPIRVVLADEVDRYPSTAGSEGDPVNLARKRTTTFWNRKLILTSTPTDENSRILRAFNQSDQRRYHVPCPHCGHMQTLKWSNIVIPKDDEGNYQTQNTFYTCEQGCVIDAKHKPAMVAKGEWRSTAKASTRGTVGFHLNELYSPWVQWSETAESFLADKNDPDTLKTWVNTALGEVWRNEGDKANVTVDTLRDRRENYDLDNLPDDVLFITAAADVQKDRVEILTQGWGEGKERWNIEQHFVWGDPIKDDAVWNEVDDFLLKRYTVRGNPMPIACSVIDSGGLEGTSDRVYNFTKPRNGRKVFAIKGSTEYYPPAASRPKQAGRIRTMLYMIGGDTIKDWLFFTYLKDKDKIHFPYWCDDEFFAQLLGEERKTIMFRGNPRFKWEKTRERQEVLDLHVYNEGAYAILNPDIATLKAKAFGEPVKEPEKPEPEPTLPRTTQRRRPMRRKKNWVTDL